MSPAVAQSVFRAEAGGSSRERQANGSKRTKPIAWAHMRTLRESGIWYDKPSHASEDPDQRLKQRPPTARIAISANPKAAPVYPRGTDAPTTTKVSAQDPVSKKRGDVSGGALVMGGSKRVRVSAKFECRKRSPVRERAIKHNDYANLL